MTRGAETQQSREQQVIVGMRLRGEIVPVGVLFVQRNVSDTLDRSTGRFRYAASYLSRPNAIPLDPVRIPLKAAEFRFAKFGGLPSAIRDAGPDRWGRTLIERCRQAGGHKGPLAELDYLLASPRDRAGNLHFAVDFDGAGAPRWDRLALEPESIKGMDEVREAVKGVLRRPDPASHRIFPDSWKALLTGSGGARPKINLQARDGTYLVKMANPVSDVSANARIETASLAMASIVGIEVTGVSARGAQAGSDLVAVRRFDVCPDGRRLQMVSAMTVLDADDAPYKRENWSYPLLAIELDRWSSQPAKDKEQLYRAMVLRAMLSDADDHPRNYALICDPDEAASAGSTLGRWRLSPMYDSVAGLGAGRRASELAMEIGDRGFEVSRENMLSRCETFGLTHERASQIIDMIETTVLDRFEAVMRESGVPEKDIALTMTAVVPLDARPRENAVQLLLDRMNGQSDAPADAPPR